MSDKWYPSIKVVGIVFLILGILSAFFFYYPKEWKFYEFINVFYVNVATDCISIAITILLIDYLYQRHDDEQLKYRLVWEMGSIDQGFAIRATKELRARNWLYDGTLTNQDLERANLEGADLRNANLSGANLRKANLQGTQLEKANLQNVDLSDAVLYEARLEECNLKGAKASRARLQKAQLYRVNLTNADLLGALLRGAELRNSDLSFARLEETDLSQADFTSAKLKEANLLRSNLAGAVFRNVDLERANLSEIENWQEIENIEGAKLSGVINPPTGFLEWAVEKGAII